jgi:hypothetical protein
VHGKLQYRVRWKGRDPATGQDYEPTWEPVANGTKALIESWQQQPPPEASASGRAEQSRVDLVRVGRFVSTSMACDEALRA